MVVVLIIGSFLFCSLCLVLTLLIAKLYRKMQKMEETEKVGFGALQTKYSTEDEQLMAKAEFLHYQQQKNLMIAAEKNRKKIPDSSIAGDGDSSEDENQLTVFECTGLAPHGEMEIKNPIFDDIHQKIDIPEEEEEEEEE